MRDQDEEQGFWISPWGAAAFGAGALALLQASVLGLWWLTVGLAALGLLLVAWGVQATREDRRGSDQVWFAVGGCLSGVVLLLALAAPGLLNGRWVIDTSVPRPDLESQVVVGRNEFLAEGRPLEAGDWADAATEAIRQGDVFVRVESVQVGPPPGKPDTPCLLVHLHVKNCRHQTVTVEGFAGDRQPVLNDEAGGTCPFLEALPRVPAKGAPVFDASASQAAELGPLERQDYLLVFAAPPSASEALKLEVPASAWGRKGACRFRIARLFDTLVSVTP